MWREDLRKKYVAYLEESRRKEVDLIRMLETREK